MKPKTNMCTLFAFFRVIDTSVFVSLREIVTNVKETIFDNDLTNFFMKWAGEFRKFSLIHF